MKHKYLTFMIMLLAINGIEGQSLQDFIDMGLESNRQLQTSHANYTVALKELESAKKKRSLSLDFIPTYTLAAGGRTIDIPVGDLLNPVYGTLNQLTGSDQFPEINNESELLNPNNFYDLKLRASYPIINTSITINEEIKALKADISKHKITQYEDQLIADINMAYFDYQMTEAAIDILREAASLISESIRVNRGLYRNGKALSIDLEAALNDSIQLQKDIGNALISKSKAAAYLNFLVNRPFDLPIEVESNYNALPGIPLSEMAGNRSELKQLDNLKSINNKLKELAKSESGPQFNVFMDLGVQDFDFNVDGQSPYLLAGLTFNLNLYDGGQTKAKVLLAEARTTEVIKHREAVEQQIELEQYVALRTLESTFNTYEATQSEVNLRQRQYQDQMRRYKIGKVGYIAIQDARNNLIQLQLQQNITRYQAWKEVAQYKKSLAINN